MRGERNRERETGRERKREEREFQEREKTNHISLNIQRRDQQEIHQNNSRSESSNRNSNHECAVREKEIKMQFIFSQSNLVDADIMQGVIYNQDRDISLALAQIHERSLNKNSSVKKTSIKHVIETTKKIQSNYFPLKKTFAEVEKNPPAQKLTYSTQ